MSIEKIKETLHSLQSNDFDTLPCRPWYWQTGVCAHASWREGVRVMATWFEQQAVISRDAVVILPQSAHLPLARQAWVKECGGWMPQFETVSSLRERLPSLPDVNADIEIKATDALVLDQTIDALMITRRLTQSAAGQEWARQRPEHLALAVERVMALAHDWIKVCLSLSPSDRCAYVTKAKQWMQTYGLPDSVPVATLAEGIGGRERWLADQALNWALQSWPALAHRTQALFDHRPVAWLLVTVGQSTLPGSDAALMCHVLKCAAQQGIAVSWMPACWSAKASPNEQQNTGPSLTQTQNFDNEARAAAAWVIHLVNERRKGHRKEPVALITHDRAISRRIRALLMTQEVAGKLVIADESGWTLSTTRAAAAVTRLLAAAHPNADVWDVMDWLLHGWITHRFDEQAVECLAEKWRKQQVLKPWLQADTFDLLQQSDDLGLWLWAKNVLAPIQALATGTHTLLQGLAVLAQVLQTCGTWRPLLLDEAGLTVLKVLHLNTNNMSSTLEAVWVRTATRQTLNLEGLSAWVSQNLARVNYEPSVSAVDADVVLTPIGKAVLRPFSGVVMPGVDERQLGMCPPAGHLLGTLELGLDMPSPQMRTETQWQAFALLSAQPQVRAVYRQNRDGEPCGPSAWLGRWWWQAYLQSWPHHWPLTNDPCVMHAIQPQTLHIPMPAIGHEAAGAAPDSLWPARLSASAYQRLRDCPYRYFALDILKLKAVDEVEDAMASHDYGIWLHEVLKRYHEHERETKQASDAASSAFADQSVRTWLVIADETAETMGLLQGGKRAFYSLYRSTLPSLATHYLRWHMAQVKEGWQWHGLEKSLAFDLQLPRTVPSGHIRLYGELDRIDVKGATHWRIIDYKTGALNTLKAQVKQALEDTQMAFYALLAQANMAHENEKIHALYLRLHHEAVEQVTHDHVQASAVLLADGIASDMTRIYRGQPMPAMGEGRLCDRCEARGLCRKDHWTQATASGIEGQVKP